MIYRLLPAQLRSLEEAALSAARTSPKVFSLIPQKDGKELLRKPCQEASPLNNRDSYLAQYTCDLGSGKVHVTARSEIQEGKWTPWQYQMEDKSIRAGARESGLLVYLSGQRPNGFSYATELQVEEKTASDLFGNHPFPQNTSLSLLEGSDGNRTVIQTLCKVDPALQTYRDNEGAHIEAIGQDLDCGDFFRQRRPQWVQRLFSEEKGDQRTYRLGEWVWRQPIQVGWKTIDARANQQVALLKNGGDFVFRNKEELFRELTRRFFPPPLVLETVTAKGEEARQYGSSAPCSWGAVDTDWEQKKQIVRGTCAFESGRREPMELVRNFGEEERDGDPFYSVSDWSLFVRGDRYIVEGRKGITLTADPEGLGVIQHERGAKEEVVTALQKRYEKYLSRRYHPKLYSVRSDLTLASGRLASRTLPSVGERHSEKAEKFFDDARNASIATESVTEQRGLMANLHGELYLGSIVGASVGGPFVIGGLQGGTAGEYDGKGLHLLELRLGLGASLAEMLGFQSSWDISFRTFLLRKGWTSANQNFLSNDQAGFDDPLFGGCFHYERFHSCLDYFKRKEAMYDFHMTLLSLGFDLGDGRSVGQVEIGE